MKTKYSIGQTIRIIKYKYLKITITDINYNDKLYMVKTNSGAEATIGFSRLHNPGYARPDRQEKLNLL